MCLRIKGLVRHPDPGRNPEGSRLCQITKGWPEVLTDVATASSRQAGVVLQQAKYTAWAELELSILRAT